jgi:hypothetical protein
MRILGAVAPHRSTRHERRRYGVAEGRRALSAKTARSRRVESLARTSTMEGHMPAYARKSDTTYDNDTSHVPYAKVTCPAIQART